MGDSIRTGEVRGPGRAFRRIRQACSGPCHRPQDNLQRQTQLSQHAQWGRPGPQPPAPLPVSHERHELLPGFPDYQRDPVGLGDGLLGCSLGRISLGDTHRTRRVSHRDDPGGGGIRGRAARSGQRVPYGCLGMRPRRRYRGQHL